ncbi:MAG: hypothetical protein K0R55_2838 [Sporomusa sp.]|jgi:hypothetical protein|nr:hypothetical protein [Sporomusa sp.]
MLASYDKIVKYLVEKFQTALSPLEQISRNQDIIIAQNKQMIELLANLDKSRESNLVPKPAANCSETASEDALSSETQS